MFFNDAIMKILKVAFHLKIKKARNIIAYDNILKS